MVGTKNMALLNASVASTAVLKKRLLLQERKSKKLLKSFLAINQKGMSENQFINPVTGEIIEIKSIEKCEHPPMRGWYRVFEEDGSTIAYTPDITTATVVSVSFAMMSLFQLISDSKLVIDKD
jgi:hypothetical protein